MNFEAEAQGIAEVSLSRPGQDGSPCVRRRFAVASGPVRVELSCPRGVDSGDLSWRIDLWRKDYALATTIGTLGRGEEQFTHPQSVAIGSEDRLYVVDSGNDRIQVLSNRNTYLFEFGGFTLDPSGRLSESDAQRFDEPADAVQSINRDIFVTDRNNNRIVKLDRDGRFLLSFGPESGLKLPRGIASNSLGEVLVADTDNDRVLVFDRSGRMMKQLGTFGWGQRQFRTPFDVSVDRENNVYVADTLNDRVQVFDQFGKLLRIISGGFKYPQAVRVDSDGFVWIVDGRQRQVLRYTPSGRQACRLGSPEYDLAEPSDIAETSTGDLYIVDRDKSRLVAISTRTSHLHHTGKVLAVPSR